MVNFLKKNVFFIFFVLILSFFYSPFLLKNKLPIPSDTIVGLYHPFRDFMVDEYPRGYPFKNFLITDPVRQTYIWKDLSNALIKSGTMPIWNPYEMSGKPLLANFQSGVFYPLNFIFFVLPFSLSWSFFIIFQSLLGCIFMFLFLKEYKLDTRAIFLGTISFVFSGFFIAWLEWGNILHTAIWLPLILLSIKKIIGVEEKKIKKRIIYFVLLLFSICSSLFAGHLQIFFYVILSTILFTIIGFLQSKSEKPKDLILIFIAIFSAFLITSIQWVPTINFINHSARSIDQNYLTTEGFFLPFSHLIQFIVPDFFGNPVTLNYWGTWNYGELVGYIGIVPLFFALFSILNLKKERKSIFFIILLFVSLLFSLPTLISKLPYLLNIPLISSAQPTRLIMIICFSLSTLAAFGMDQYLKDQNSKKVLIVSILFISTLVIVWGFLLTGINFKISPQNLEIAKRNFVIPTIIVLVTSILVNLQSKSKITAKYLIYVLIIITTVDLLRFANKFTVFSEQKFLYPTTGTIEFLKKQDDIFRIASVDDRILPPNFATFYRLQSIEGYDPLYLKSYAEFIAASEREEPNIEEPYGFNRIITPSNFNSPLYDLLNVKFILSLNELKSEKLRLAYTEGQTKVYENLKVSKRTFFIENIIYSTNSNDSIQKLFQYDLSKTAIVESGNPLPMKNNGLIIGKAEIISYRENEVIIQTNNIGDGFLVLTDTYYPNWHVMIDDIKSTIFKTNHTFRGVFIPGGNHIVKFYVTLF